MTHASERQESWDRQIAAEQILDRFEAAWRDGPHPRLRDWLERHPGLSEILGADLLALDVHYRRLQGETPSAADYPDLPVTWIDRALPGAGPEVPSTAKDSRVNHRPRASDPSLPTRIGGFEILDRLGRGGFGEVFLAYDPALDRQVALKVPRDLTGDDLHQEWLREARMAARLDHPHIVPVYHVGNTVEFPVFIVSKYIDGCSLADRLKQAPLPLSEALDLVIDVAGALEYAHQAPAGVIHRDIKPDNLLLDRDDTVFVSDFGLARRESDLRWNPHIEGTPAYMSPEQARGEGHRVDERSDLFSLAIVFYELLTGVRPFVGRDVHELLDQIEHVEPRPPRSLNPAISPALEQVCLKALAKHPADRFATLGEFGDELRRLREGERIPPITAAPASAPASVSGTAPASHGAGDGANSATPLLVSTGGVRTRGLRAFEAEDAELFRELLAGQKDCEGLPESLRFWKQRIEQTDPLRTFSVGVLTGGSGSGKSSLIRAGLIPRLSDQVVTISIEASADRTEVDLLQRLHGRLPRLRGYADLAGCLRAVRRDMAGLGRRKLLLVIDQFEQWLHAHQRESSSGLGEALRQADGHHLQCLLLVRDDYAMGLLRFLRQLEIALDQGHNSQVLDRFDLAHAARVLRLFGQALGRLPVDEGALSPRQRQFIDLAIAGLAEQNQVAPVRLALFAELFRNRDWSPEAWIAVGEADGVGRAFLEETFRAPTAPPQYRRHSQAAQRVLAALLPEPGSDLRGHRQSLPSLQAAAGYADQPREAAELLRILDRDLRLISPFDECPEVERPIENPVGAGQAAAGSAGDVTPTRSYHLAHDYLVSSVRRWLEDIEGATPAGRVQKLLQQQSRLWNDRPHDRNLPSLLEHVQTRWHIRPGDRSPAAQRMLARAAMVHGRRLLLTLVSALALMTGGWLIRERVQIAGWIAQLQTAGPREWSGLLRRLTRPATRPRAAAALRSTLVDVPEADCPVSLRVARLVIEGDKSQLASLREQLLTGPREEFLPLREQLLAVRNELVPGLWDELRDESQEATRRLRAGMSLAGFLAEEPPETVPTGEGQSTTWTAGDLAFLARSVVAANPETQPQLREALRSIQARLLPSFERIYSDDTASETERLGAANAVLDFAPDDVARLTRLLITATPAQHAVLYPAFEARAGSAVVAKLAQTAARQPDEGVSIAGRVALGRMRANSAATLMRLGEIERALGVFEMTDDPEALTQFLFSCRPRGVTCGQVLAGLDWLVSAAPARIPPRARYGLLLTLGEYRWEEIPETRRQPLLKQLIDWYTHDPSSAVHAATHWLLRRWGHGAEVDRLDQQEQPYRVGYEWFRRVIEVQPDEDPKGVLAAIGQKLDKQQLSMTFVVHPAGDYAIGAVRVEPEGETTDARRRVRLTRAFAVLDREVTFREMAAYSWFYRRFSKAVNLSLQTAAAGVDWYDGVRFCRWLGEAAGVAEVDQPYPDPDSLDPATYPRDNTPSAFEAPEDWPIRLHRPGFRLPTDAEWEIAARGGAGTIHACGHDENLLTKYAWLRENSSGQLQPGRLLAPNLRGVFDMIGNVAEWVHDWHVEKPENDLIDPIGRPGLRIRTHRGGGLSNSKPNGSVSIRYAAGPSHRSRNLGLRIALTLPDLTE